MQVLRPLSAAEYVTWVETVVPSYARDKVASGAWDESDALARSRQEYDSLLPDGQNTPENYLCSILAEDGGQVGMLWFAVKDRGKTRVAYLFNIEVFPEHQRRGHAQRALSALQDEVKRLGLNGIALHVFGHNTAAQALYARLGYAPTNVNMYKALRTDA